MAYLGANPLSPTIQIRADAPAGVVAGKRITFHVNAFPFAEPVWVSITPAHLVVRAGSGTGRIDVQTDGCAANGRCDRRPLYALTGTPIPPAPPGGVVTKQGFALHLDTGAMEPGRYDFTLPIRYPSSDAHPDVLDVSDVLHVRIDVYSTRPPPSRCTATDLHEPPAVITPAHTLTDTIVVEGGSTRLDPPPHGYQPHVTAARALRRMTPVRAGGGEATLALASVSELLPASRAADGSLRSVVHDVVAWVLYTQHVAVDDDAIITPAPRPGSPTTPPNACFFSDGINAINATTGAQMDSGGGSAAPDPIHF